MLKHACGKPVILNLSDMYIIASPSLKIEQSGITPGMIEIAASGKKSSVSLGCKECNVSLTTKSDYESEVTGVCNICTGDFKPSQLYVTPYVTLICESCITNGASRSTPPAGARLLSLYYEVLKSQKNEFPTLLTVMCKK